MQTLDPIENTSHLLSHLFIKIDSNIIRNRNQYFDQKDLIGCPIGCNCIENCKHFGDNWSENGNRWPVGWCECSHNRCEVDSNYAENGLLVNRVKPIHECGDNCFCSTSPLLKSQCSNRWTQRPTTCVTQLFVHPLKGYSIRTLNDIKSGQYITEYLGEVLNKSEAKNRFKLYSDDSEEHNYILIFREHFGSESTFEIIIDAKNYGNESRFINHSCDPNLIALPVRSDSLRPRICLFAAKDIVGGSELSYNYGSNESIFSNKLCFCGSDNCKHFMPLDICL